jgi:hypothetical protein
MVEMGVRPVKPASRRSFSQDQLWLTRSQPRSACFEYQEAWCNGELRHSASATSAQGDRGYQRVANGRQSWRRMAGSRLPRAAWLRLLAMFPSRTCRVIDLQSNSKLQRG